MQTTESDLELLLMARNAELPGGLHVKRAIPQRQRRMVGPFVFVDQMGPSSFAPGTGADVLSHPHIGLSTITWLFEGEGIHKDSLGSVQRLLPGEVNWMTAGRGIVHAELMRAGGEGRLSGVQTWVALPLDQEECDPSFEHYGTEAVPRFDEGGVQGCLIAGSLFGLRSQVRTSSPLFYAEVRMETGATIELPPGYDERAAYVVEGRVALRETAVQPGEIAIFPRGRGVLLRAEAPTLVMLLGGDTLDGPRHISWNFVSSSRERLAQASDDWRNQRFPRIPGERAYIPLPTDGSEPVNYP